MHSVVLNLTGIDVHSRTNAAGESSSWQPLLPEHTEQPTQVEFLSKELNSLSLDSKNELSIPAGSYDLVRLRLKRDQNRIDGVSLSRRACGEVGSNCVIMEDGHFARLVFEADALEFHLTSDASVSGLPYVIPNSDNEMLIELKPVLSMVRSFGEAAPSFVILPGRAQMGPRP